MRDESHAYFVVDRFHTGASRMRRELDRRFDETLDPFDPVRFAWERWHVADQFSELRAPARSVFSTDAMAAFEERLLAWLGWTTGLSLLGGPPWVSALCDGDFQGLHRDTPNGTLTFSFGLGHGPFAGGDTLIARPELTDYWRTGSHRANRADMPLFDEVPPRFNRLIAFDSRVPHMIRRVEGPHHPRGGRVAVEGWVRPAGCVTRGDVDATRADEVMARSLAGIAPAACAGVDGLVAVGTDCVHGKLVGAREVFRTLVRTDERGNVARATAAIVRAVRAARASGSGRLVVPVMVAPDGACSLGRAGEPAAPVSVKGT